MNLPYDVWRHIVSFVPDDHVRGLLGVNHILFEIVMDELYSTVEIRWPNHRTLWILLNLQNPMIASRVRCLRFCSAIGGDFQLAWLRRYQGNTWTIRARKVLDHAFHAFTPNWHHHKITARVDCSKRIKMSLHDLITMLINAFPALPNLCEFEDIRSGPKFTPAYDMEPLYRAAFTAFGSNLRKLVLRREVGSFSEVLKYAPHLPRLQELRITFAYPSPEGIHDLEMQNIVAPFISQHKSTMQTLSFILQGMADLSPLFLAIETLPTLRELEIYIPTRYVPWSNLSGLARFLQRHMGILHYFTWRQVGTELPRHSKALTLTTRASTLALGGWLLDNAVALSQLKTLCVRTVDSEDFQSILAQCRCSVNSLTTLSLHGYPLSHDQVNNLVSIFSSPPARLVNLNILVNNLGPGLIFLLEERLPRLKRLSIYTCQITPSSETSFSDELQLKFGHFPDWQLYDIGIWQIFPPTEIYRVDGNFMYMLARLIPRVSSFWGLGYMSMD